MAKTATTRISPGRAQDWISSVLNPIIDGLRLQKRFLPDGPWRWIPHLGAFEYLHPLADYLAETYRDNYDDFLRKQPALRQPIARHDGLLKELRSAVRAAYMMLIEHPN